MQAYIILFNFVFIIHLKKKNDFKNIKTNIYLHFEKKQYFSDRLKTTVKRTEKKLSFQKKTKYHHLA